MIDKIKAAKEATKYYNNLDPNFLNGVDVRPDEISDCGDFVTFTFDPKLKLSKLNVQTPKYTKVGDVVTAEFEVKL